MENWLLSDKEKNYDIEWLVQNNEQFFDSVANHLKSKDEKIISKVCSRLSSLYKEKDPRYQFLIVNSIPILINYYFIHFYEEKICSIIEVCLLTIYNLSLSDENMKLNRIRIPNLSLPSIYHSPQAAATQSELSESALSKLESEYVIVEEQFKPYLDTINSEKRFNLIRFLLLLYLSRLSGLTKQSKLYFCDSCLKICKINRGSLKTQPIYLNSQILIEMLNGLYYLFNNGLELDAYIAIEAISAKADEELLADVMLMCNSIKNLIQKSKKEPINPKELVAIQESRRKMSDNPANIKQAQQELNKANLKLDKDAESLSTNNTESPANRKAPLEQQESTDIESINNEFTPNIPVIDENDDSSSSYSLAEKL